MTKCNATVWHPDCWTGQPKAVPARCRLPAEVGSEFCHRHWKMARKGFAIERFDKPKGTAMRKILLAATAVTALACGLSSEAQAVVCTGTTMTVANGENASAAFLLTPGNCVAVSDKIFGEFTSSGAITGTGSASFSFFTSPGDVTLGFSGVVGPNAVGGINYVVAVDPALSQGFLIDDLEKDFTFNAAVSGLPASATLDGTVNPGAIAFNCNRTVNPSGGTCPQIDVFSPVSQITVSETITTGANAIVTALTDTISQTQAVPEPGSLVLLGTGLFALGLGRRFMQRRRQSTDIERCAAA